MSGVLQNRKLINRTIVIVAVLFAAVLPFFMESGSSLLDDCTLALAYVVMGLGLNIVVGFAGLLDLGYVAFYALGAYATGWFMSGFYSDANIHIGVSEYTQSLPGVHLNWIIVAILAMTICAIAGVLIGLPTLRLRGDYIAVVTLAFGEIIRVFALNGESITFGENYALTNGQQGITPVDPIQLPFLTEFDPLNLRPWYWLALVLVLVVLFCNIRLRDSRLGRAWIAVREDEVAAASMGVPLVRTKLLAYAAGAAFGGLSGAFLGSYLNTVNAKSFQFAFSIFILSMIILGGLGSVWGVVIGAIALSFINYYLIPDVLRDSPSLVGLNFELTDLSFGIFGFLLVIMMVLRPEGLLPERRRQIELHEGDAADQQIVETKA